MVPENVHTPPRRELEILDGGGGGSKAKEISETRGVVSEITSPDGQVRCCDDPVRKVLLIVLCRHFT